MDNCSGVCQARFYHFKGGNEVTDRCDVNTCEKKECSGSRECVEEAFPLVCPNEGETCRQYLRARCMISEKPAAPATCDLVLCPNGTVCMVEENRSGSIAKCRERKPQSCQEIECSDDLVCFERRRDKEGKPPILRCIEEQLPRFPENCAAVLCPEKTICRVFGAESKRPRARCVKLRDDEILTCEELDCDAINMECREMGDEGAKCVPPACPAGLVSRQIVLNMNGNTVLQELCILPGNFADNCEEANCDGNQVCILESFPERNVSSASCASQDVLDQTPAAETSSCEELTCEEGQECVLMTVGEQPTHAYCAQSDFISNVVDNIDAIKSLIE